MPRANAPVDDVVLTRAQVREIDRIAVEELKMSGLVLMENAGRGSTDLLLEQDPFCTDDYDPTSDIVSICCGKGNNGGDGFVIARHLDNRGVAARVLLFGSPDELRGDADANFRLLRETGVEVEPWTGAIDEARLTARLEESSWIVDALLGTGTKGEIRGPFDSIIRAINAARCRVFAMDIPSGLDCDTGRALEPCVRAERTATCVAAKRGFFTEEAVEFLGRWDVVDIGVPRSVLRRAANFSP